MNKKSNKNEEKTPTLSDALAFLIYHLGMFFLKVTAIACIWIIVVHYLSKLMLK